MPALFLIYLSKKFKKYLIKMLDTLSSPLFVTAVITKEGV